MHSGEKYAQCIESVFHRKELKFNEVDEIVFEMVMVVEIDILAYLSYLRMILV